MADPTDTPLRTTMIQLHEAFVEAQRAGFTAQEAIQIVVGMARGNR